MFKQGDVCPEALACLLEEFVDVELVNSSPYRIYCVVAVTEHSHAYLSSYGNYPFVNLRDAWGKAQALQGALEDAGFLVETLEVYGEELTQVATFKQNVSEEQVVKALSGSYRGRSLDQEEAEALEAASFGFSGRHLNPVVTRWDLRV